MPPNPLRRDDLVITEVYNQLMLYSVEQGAVHVLNLSAKQIWDLCDGTHSSEQMAEALAAAFSVPDGRDLQADVAATLAVFSEKGLLQPSPGF